MAALMGVIDKVLLYLLAINLATFAVFGWDKRRSVADLPRIREIQLLWLAALGGSFGALVARRMFRHKTRKQPFSNQLILIAALQLGAAIFAVVLFSGGRL
jgi:uncharacterized membrane protein YsdA (DUF1294 family)